MTLQTDAIEKFAVVITAAQAIHELLAGKYYSVGIYSNSDALLAYRSGKQRCTARKIVIVRSGS